MKKIFKKLFALVFVVILSTDKSVGNITNDQFMQWLELNEDTFYGLPVVTDESGELAYIEDAVLFDTPISEIIDQYGVTSEEELLTYGEDAYNLYYTTDYAPQYASCVVEIVRSTHFRF